jgi:hypothetical protein
MDDLIIDYRTDDEASEWQRDEERNEAAMAIAEAD